MRTFFRPKAIAAAIVAALLITLGQVGDAVPIRAGLLSPERHVFPTGLRMPATIHVAHLVRSAPAGTYPDSASVRAYAPAPRQQGNIGSCASNATSELEAWYENRLGVSQPDGYAPMYYYAAIMAQYGEQGGPNTGTSFDDNLNRADTLGAVPVTRYSYGANAAMYDFTDRPTPADDAVATGYRIISSWQYGDASYTGGQYSHIGAQAETDIKYGLSVRQQPVLLGIHVYDTMEFWNGQGTIPGEGTQYYGDHAILALAYDAGGVWALNSWGTGWGQGGYAYFSWSFIDSQVFAVLTATAQAMPVPTPIPTGTPLPTATDLPTPTPVPTDTSTAIPTATPIPPAPPSTATPIHKRKHRKHLLCPNQPWLEHTCRTNLR